MQRAQELPVLGDQDSLLTPYRIENGRVHLKGHTEFLFKPVTLLHLINQSSFAFDTVIGIAASAQDQFDQFLQRKEALAFLIPTYLTSILLVPIAYIVFRHFKPENISELRMPPEDRLLIAKVNTLIQNEAIEIKRQRLQKKNQAEHLTHVPTFLLCLSLHSSYCFVLGMQKDGKARENFFVEKFDLLAPALIGGMLMGLSFLNKCILRERAEKSFEDSVEHKLNI